MVITRASANAPITFSGQIVAFAHDSTYNERIITSVTNQPLRFADRKIEYSSTGGNPAAYTNV